MEIQVSYVRKSKRSEVYVLLTIESKGLGQRFEEKRRGRPADVFNIIQKRPNTVVHLKVDEATKGRRSHKKMRRAGRRRTFLTICQAYCKCESSSNPTGPRNKT